MRSDDQVFGQFLVDAGLVTRGQLESLRQSGNKTLSQSLVDSGILSEDEARKAAAHALGVPFVAIEPYDIAIETLVLIPEPFSRSRGIIAFAADEHIVKVALLDLSDLEALRALTASHLGGRKIVPHLTTRETVKRALLKYQQHLKEQFGELLADGRHVAEALIKHALYSKAGGAHVDLSTHGALVRYQIGHALHEAMRLPAQVGHALAREIKLLAKLLPVARPQEGMFKVEKDKEVVHVRVSTSPTVDGERIHLRLAREAHGQLGHTLEALGFHGENLAALHVCLEKRRGLLVVSGAEGSGKSTLLYTLLDLMQHPGVAIATVEERVGYRLPYAAQSEAGEGVSFAAALRAAARQHPDVLMADSVVDSETASLVVSAAARGIFVLAGVERGAEELFSYASGQNGSAPEGSSSAPHTLVRLALARRLATNQFVHARPLSRREQDALEEGADFRKVYEALKEEKVIDPGIAWKDVAFAHPTPSTEYQDGYLPAQASGSLGAQEVVAPGFETLTIVEDALFKAAQGQTSVEEAIRLAGQVANQA